MINHIYVRDLIGITGNEDARDLYIAIFTSIINHQKIEVSFKDVPCITSRFVNTGLIALLDRVSFSKIKKYVFIIDSNNHINAIINKRFKFEVDGVTL